MKLIKTEVCVIGAGAGGTGCVYRLIKNGIKTVVVDKNPDFGGTAVFCGVDGWEPGVSLNGMHQLLVKELESMPNACHVVEQIPNCNFLHPENGDNWDNIDYVKYPWGYSVPNGLPYSATLARCTLLCEGTHISRLKRFQFEPYAMIKAINNVLEPYKKKLTALFGYCFTDCETSENKVTSITVSNGKEEIKIEAKFFVDSSGDIVLARKAGCAYAFGTEGRDEYNEPSAQEKSGTVNGVTYVFRIRQTADNEYIDKIPPKYADFDLGEWERDKMKSTVSVLVRYPNGDINVNMLPTMDGETHFSLGNKADETGRARVYAYWHFLQTQKGLKGYTLLHIFDAGIREGYRLRGKYVLNENDLRMGFLRQPKLGKTVAIADHAMDIHGKNGMCRELETPYEIPIECCMTKEYGNLYAACRGASFTHIAASSARLTRTVLSMGEGVGEELASIINAADYGAYC